MPRVYTRKSLAERFWPKVNTNGPVIRVELGQCHIWTGALSGNGYGHIRTGGKREPQIGAHVAAFFLKHGKWPKPDALHHCDNKPCVRWEHLFEGTPLDNTRDMIAKGRLRTNDPAQRLRGEAHPMARLTDDDVRQIRSMALAGEPRQAIAVLFGIKECSVYNILSGRSWSHVP